MKAAPKPSTAKSKRPTKKTTSKSASAKSRSTSTKAVRVTRLPGGRKVATMALLGWGALSLGIILFLCFGVIYFFTVENGPTKVFWSAMSNSMSTPGVTRVVTQDDSDGHSVETATMDFGIPTAAYIHKNLNENTNNPSNAASIEGIGTYQYDYQRYLDVKRLGTDGKPIDYSKIYNIWIKTNDSGTAGEPASSPTILTQTLLGPVLLGNLQAKDRREVLSELQSGGAYTFNKSDITRTVVSGHVAYQYPLTINLRPYAVALSSYANALGLPGASNIDPKNYGATDKLQLIMYVDKYSHQLLKISYVGSNVTELYSNYGVYQPTSYPTDSIPTNVFQQKLEKIPGQSSS